MSVRVAGLVTLAVFYALFFALGTYVGRRTRGNKSTDGLLLAGRRLPLVLGLLTMTATWVDGGYINGTAEALYNPDQGLLWAQAPWGYALSLLFGGLIFARPMRRHGFTTMVDLFDRRWGKRVAAVLFVPAVLGEIFWSGAILAALGMTISTMLGMERQPAILISAAVAIAYTMTGGLWSVAWTDSLQFVCIAVGLGVAAPFLIEQAGGLSAVVGGYRERFGAAAWPLPASTTFGLAPGSDHSGWRWTDGALLLICGGIPWQVYFQRVLACRTDRAAVAFSIGACFLCLAMAVPPAMIGATAASIDWSAASVGPPPEAAMVLPYMLRYLAPPMVAAVGLGAIAAAVMSSIDSSFLSASSMFVWNVYRPLLRPHADAPEIRAMVRVAIVLVGSSAAVLALTANSIYALWVLCSDLIYVVLFPQMICALFVRWTNAAGSLAGAAVAFGLRMLAGEPSLGIPPLASYPMTDAEGVTSFPFRTVAMLAGLATLLAISRLTASAFPSRGLDASPDDGAPPKPAQDAT
jgi:high affinity choline transporter 7